MTRRTIEVDCPVAEAWKKLHAAASAVGKIEESHDGSHFLIMKARYGLNTVRLRAAVLPGASGSTSVVDIGGHGQDVFDIASRKVIDRLCAAL